MNPLEKLELSIAKLLRVGVVISGLMMLLGFVMQFSWSGNALFNFTVYDQIPFTDIVQTDLKWKRWGPLISYAGLLILISLPLIRVVLTTYLFIRQKEYHLAGIASLVFLGLMLSMALGIQH